MTTSLTQNKTLKRLELRSDGLTQYKDAKLFTQHLVLGAARSTTLTGVCIRFSSWWRDCHIQSECAFLSCNSLSFAFTMLITCGSLPVQWWDTVIFMSLSCKCTDKAQRCTYSLKTIMKYFFGLSYNSFISPFICYKQAMSTSSPQQACHSSYISTF